MRELEIMHPKGNEGYYPNKEPEDAIKDMDASILNKNR
jgi:hypothetical protein